MNELRIGEVFKVSIDTYKQKWKTLLLISLISTIISISVSLINIFTSAFELPQLKWLLIFAMVNLVLTLISTYFIFRLSVAMILTSDKAINDEDIALSKSYGKAKYLTWRYIGKSILFALMLIIPTTMVIVGSYYGHTLGISLPIRAILIVVGILLTLYLNTMYDFSLYVAVLFPKEESVFSCSKLLVKGNFFKVLIITLIPYILASPMYAITFFLKIDTLSVSVQIFYALVSNIPSILLAPLSVLISVVALDRLKKANIMPLTDVTAEALCD